MSRGPGRIQRLILRAVADGCPHRLADLLPLGYTRAQYNALNRAAGRLEDEGRIVVHRLATGWRRTVVARPGVAPRIRPTLKVGAVASDPSNTYAADGTP